MLHRRAFLASTLAVLAAPATAQEAENLWRALAGGGHAALMRHAEAPGTGDPPGFRLGECETQRNLNEAGRQFSAALGAEFRRRDVRVSRVLSSEWCRCLDTARLLALGPVQTAPDALNSFFESPGDKARSTAALRNLLGSLPRDAASVLVTHQVNITALTGVFPASGEIVVLRLEPDGGYAVAGRLAPR
jgi:phosphohistidine phosphatase SixA